jgi:hypothetical protein
MNLCTSPRARSPRLKRHRLPCIVSREARRPRRPKPTNGEADNLHHRPKPRRPICQSVRPSKWTKPPAYPFVLAKFQKAGSGNSHVAPSLAFRTRLVPVVIAPEPLGPGARRDIGGARESRKRKNRCHDDFATCRARDLPVDLLAPVEWRCRSRRHVMKRRVSSSGRADRWLASGSRAPADRPVEDTCRRSSDRAILGNFSRRTRDPSQAGDGAVASMAGRARKRSAQRASAARPLRQSLAPCRKSR